MEKIKVRCRTCGKELEANSGKTYSCGCPNMMTIRGSNVSAVNMDDIVFINSHKKTVKEGLTDQDMQWQEKRSKRKIRKLDFEVR